MTDNKLTKEGFLLAVTRYSKIQPHSAPDFGDPFVVDFWWTQVGHYGREALGAAFSKLCCKNKFPSINDIKEECGDGSISDDTSARLAADLIWSAIGKFGGLDYERASEYFGEIGQKVVGGASGWKSICDTATYNQATTLKAQWREAAKGFLEMSRKGFDGPPRLPEPNAGQLRLKSDNA